MVGGEIQGTIIQILDGVQEEIIIHKLALMIILKLFLFLYLYLLILVLEDLRIMERLAQHMGQQVLTMGQQTLELFTELVLFMELQAQLMGQELQQEL